MHSICVEKNHDFLIIFDFFKNIMLFSITATQTLST